MSVGKSQAQDILASKIENAYPFASVTQEVPIAKLIVSSGYSPAEIGAELGHKPHRMFVDILLSSSEITCAFEYQGRQHYEQVGNMTSSSSALLWNQELDREKTFILERLGIPVVRIAYDEYVDSSVIRHRVEEAFSTLDEMQGSLIACEVCNRLFPIERLSDGVCGKCQKEAAGLADSVSYDKYGIPSGMYNDDISDDDDIDIAFSSMSAESRKEYMKKKRKEAYQAYKASDEYRKRKEEAKLERRRRYQEFKLSKKNREGDFQ